jgi:hypothetical protein
MGDGQDQSIEAFDVVGRGAGVDSSLEFQGFRMRRRPVNRDIAVLANRLAHLGSLLCSLGNNIGVLRGSPRLALAEIKNLTACKARHGSL